MTFPPPVRKPRCLIQGPVGPGEVPVNLSLQVQVSDRCLLILMHHAQPHSVALAPRYFWEIHQIITHSHLQGINQIYVILEGKIGKNWEQNAQQVVNNCLWWSANKIL